MSTQKANSSEKISLKMNSKSIKAKTQEFLSSRRKLQPLNDIIKEFEVCVVVLPDDYRFFPKNLPSLRLCDSMESVLFVTQ